MAADFNACEVPRDELGGALSKRFEGYKWQPERSWATQVDGAQRVCFYGDAMLDDPAAFLAGYELGSNATLFSPQGGLRASADDLPPLCSCLSTRVLSTVSRSDTDLSRCNVEICLEAFFLIR